ncbi:hypothetical protein CDD81_1169 [Ophiocordyceps australis]|uniref:DASH complex subunit ASK1 n=1 Tax=Ophiocordyceps australis TaxID=1399860 RepID=A0A2C5Y0N1_9HYPO|nr:hypothetical protein CDD81_1169 [Ophiocordyceps australis]
MPRNLTLTEELEKLEQSITLTLQEIDHNFSKAHRIVTTSILPLVDQYGEHSRAVWEASKFWKQFFEASANVSLSGYEELANDDQDDNQDSIVLQADASSDFSRDDTNDEADNATGTMQSALDAVDDSLLGEGDATGGTPRLTMPMTRKATTGDMQDHEGDASLLSDKDDSTAQFAQRTARLLDLTMSSRAILDDGTSNYTGQRQKDPLLHRVLDKNYRLQATPHKPAFRISPVKGDRAKQTEASAWRDLSPMSSPELAAPRLRTEAFMSPVKADKKVSRFDAAGPRTPGVSIQTPVTAKKTSHIHAHEPKYEIDWDSDDEDMSPPKTFQFALPPSKLLQTPAGEASKRIVDDILMNAGADVESSEYSPSTMRMNQDVLKDSF